MVAPHSFDQRVSQAVLRRLANARLRSGTDVFDAVVERLPRTAGEYGDRTEIGTRITVLRSDIVTLARGATIVYDSASYTPEELGALAAVTYTVDERDEDDTFVAAYWVIKA
ncbi:MAG: hypothetical protein ACREYA_20520 [Cupriavidus necator]